jgi:26S proteasome regulatory subunit N13
VKATPTARVFLLKFTSGRKLFFWLQEPKDDKDKEYEEKTNQFINNPPPPDQSAGDVPNLH